MKENIKWSTERIQVKEDTTLQRLQDLYKMPWASMKEIESEAYRRASELVESTKLKLN